MIKIFLTGVLLSMILSATVNAANQLPRFVVPSDFRGAIFLIGTSTVSKKLQGEIKITQRGVVLCATLDPIKHKTLSDLTFRFDEGQQISSGDADTIDKNIHVWNVALGSGTVEGQYIEYIVVFIGTAEKRRRVFNTKVDLNIINGLLHSARAEQKTE